MVMGVKRFRRGRGVVMIMGVKGFRMGRGRWRGGCGDLGFGAMNRRDDQGFGDRRLKFQIGWIPSLKRERESEDEPQWLLNVKQLKLWEVITELERERQTFEPQGIITEPKKTCKPF